MNLKSKTEVEVTIENPELEAVKNDPAKYISFYHRGGYADEDIPEKITKRGTIEETDYETFTCVVRCDDGTYVKVSMSDVKEIRKQEEI